MVSVKSNPLFVDSTKLQGDRVGTQIELRGIFLYDDESLSILVQTQSGEFNRTLMRPSDDGCYEARVWLNHQELITYQFVIEKENQYKLQSFAYKAHAQYFIVQDWEPSPYSSILAAKALKSAPQKDSEKPPWLTENLSSVRSLMDRWGL